MVTEKSSLDDAIIQVYDEFYTNSLYDEFYSNSGYRNYGWWGDGAGTPKDACDALVDTLLHRHPSRQGTVLDVACGQGGTTERLKSYFDVGDITGINLSQSQVDGARARFPELKFLKMDATELDFEDASFDNVLCVEAAFHFHTRGQFLAEAYRVLRPGGKLMLTDVLWKEGPARRAIWLGKRMGAPFLVPVANLVSLDAYAELYRAAGFQQIEIEAVDDRTFAPFVRHALRYSIKGGILDMFKTWLFLSQMRRWHGHYLVVSVVKSDPDA